MLRATLVGGAQPVQLGQRPLRLASQPVQLCRALLNLARARGELLTPAEILNAQKVCHPAGALLTPLSAAVIPLRLSLPSQRHSLLARLILGSEFRLNVGCFV